MQAGSFRAKRGDDPAGKQKEIAANDSQLQRAAHADCGQQDDGIARFFFEFRMKQKMIGGCLKILNPLHLGVFIPHADGRAEL